MTSSGLCRYHFFDWERGRELRQNANALIDQIISIDDWSQYKSNYYGTIVSKYSKDVNPR
jgi:hypothetical protein